MAFVRNVTMRGVHIVVAVTRISHAARRNCVISAPGRISSAVNSRCARACRKVHTYLLLFCERYTLRVVI